MRNLNNPKWLFIVNTLPIIAVFVIFAGQFNIVKSLLSEENMRYWRVFGIALGTLGIFNFAYAAFLTYKKKNVNKFYGIAALLCYIVYIYLYFYFLYALFPSSIPQWMMSSSVYLYVGTFLMPTLAYSVFITVANFTPLNKNHLAWSNFVIAAGIPTVVFLFSQFILPLWRYMPGFQFFSGRLALHLSIILFILATLFFFFFLVRGIYIISFRRAAAWRKFQLAWKIPVTIVLPLLGLLANKGFWFMDLHENSGIFGNFSSHWFFILAALNGILICLPNLDKKVYRILLFAGRSVTFSFSMYFFLVFLPFLPFSIVVILMAGTGLLMLSPIALFIVHVMEMTKDYKYIKLYFPKKIILPVLSLCFLIIPVCITSIFIKDKIVLNKALDYLYSPNYSKQYNLNKKSIRRTLNEIENNRSLGDLDFLFGGKIPYISSYFNWLVMNNLTLSDAKINYAKQVFFGENYLEFRLESFENVNVKITGIVTDSVFDASQGAWKSWVNLEISNSSNSSMQEYATVFELPEGCFISDYYLYVDGKRETGILAEKRSAMWVYTNIRNTNRDPGILFYQNGNRISFKVFPFSGKETRNTGIEFLHKEPVILHFDKNIVNLGNEGRSDDKIIETENFVYIPAAQKENLKKVQRKQYFHFLVDVSKNNEGYISDLSRCIEIILTHNESLRKDAQISLVNSYVNTFSLDDDKWRESYKKQKFEGGFYLERAIQTALYKAYKNNAYPVIVVISDDFKNAVLDNSFFDFKFAVPESGLFYRAKYDGTLEFHSLLDDPKESLSDDSSQVRDVRNDPVLEYKLSDGSTAYLVSFRYNEPEIVLKKDIFKIDEADINEKDFMSALTMQAKRMSHTLHPETSGSEWQSMVKYSFASKVMTPVTSFLVVENEAQKAALKSKQEQVLAGGKLLDLDNESQSMSEPGILVLAILFGLAMFIRRALKLKLERKECAKTL